MGKWAGKIGFAVPKETTPGVWKDEIVRRTYYGDMTRNTRRLQSSGNLNDNLVITNELSIIADPYANENFHAIRYAEFMGTKWKISGVQVQFPRLILELGEVYNG